MRIENSTRRKAFLGLLNYFEKVLVFFDRKKRFKNDLIFSPAVKFSKPILTL